MDPKEVRKAVEQWTAEHSGLEAREYLGMSMIGKCPMEIYDRMVNAREWLARTGQNHARMCYEGNLHHDDLFERLVQIGLARPVDHDLVAPFDERFRGHPDGELVSRTGNGHVTLLEIKSLSVDKFETVRTTNRLAQEHYMQVQCYMKYGGYSHCMVLVKCRETGELWAVLVTENKELQERLERKAQAILAAVDAGRPPACECGRHNGKNIPLFRKGILRGGESPHNRS